jgi:Mn2+/Fe2+ NRAMP family transporter
MSISEFVTYFIILTSAVTLHATGQTTVDSAEQLAQALRPLAGPASSVLLALGLIGTGLLAVPILTTSTAYAVAEAFHWRRGLDQPAHRAPHFYTVIVLTTLVAMEINYIGISPIRALYWTSVICGFLAPPLLALLLVISNNRKIMGNRVNGFWTNFLGGIALLLATAAAIGSVFVGS